VVSTRFPVLKQMDMVLQIERGTTSALWSLLLLAYATCTTISAYTDFTATVCAGYGGLLKASGKLIATGRVRDPDIFRFWSHRSFIPQHRHVTGVKQYDMDSLGQA
jgi:hypothetical protein